MELPVVAGIAVVALLVLTRRYAARRLMERDGRFLWLFFLPILIGGFVILGTGVQMLVTVPLAGVVMVVTGSVYLAALIAFATRASRSITPSGPQLMVEPLADFVRAFVGPVLIGGLAALVGLLVWAASQAAQ